MPDGVEGSYDLAKLGGVLGLAPPETSQEPVAKPVESRRRGGTANGAGADTVLRGSAARGSSQADAARQRIEYLLAACNDPYACFRAGYEAARRGEHFDFDGFMLGSAVGAAGAVVGRERQRSRSPPRVVGRPTPTVAASRMAEATRAGQASMQAAMSPAAMAAAMAGAMPGMASMPAMAAMASMPMPSSFMGYWKALCLALQREEVRKQKDFAASDQMRDELKDMGVEVQDRTHTFTLTQSGLSGSFDLKTGLSPLEVQIVCLEREEARRDKDYSLSDEMRDWLLTKDVQLEDKSHTFKMGNGMMGSYNLKDMRRLGGM
eukprot:TRINITY_DN28881_c0_g1_i1.p1 TRINITY_DN28881_c0_g1~~TRINITY_DN28881_c0_g1_i1.p1  ORF type:complete len:320 (+),score=79.95 TRINITY_DN28881_c0_g1_i1:412-1371(+)